MSKPIFIVLSQPYGRRAFTPIKAFNTIAAYAFVTDEMNKPENDGIDFYCYQIELEDVL